MKNGTYVAVGVIIFFIVAYVVVIFVTFANTIIVVVASKELEMTWQLTTVL
jgi:hypothetical protein